MGKKGKVALHREGRARAFLENGTQGKGEGPMRRISPTFLISTNGMRRGGKVGERGHDPEVPSECGVHKENLKKGSVRKGPWPPG